MKRVQIPLWSMNTKVLRISATIRASSDSSMVDEYPLKWAFIPAKEKVQIPLWSMNTNDNLIAIQSLAGSDSSMVDEYANWEKTLCHVFCVQIPLWSMNTKGVDDKWQLRKKFRFLYGRWILLLYPRRVPETPVQIPLWSMNTESSSRTSGTAGQVQIPLWSMNTRGNTIDGGDELSSDSSMVDEYT